MGEFFDLACARFSVRKFSAREDEAELRRILEHFVSVIEQKGDEVFSRLGARGKR